MLRTTAPGPSRTRKRRLMSALATAAALPLVLASCGGTTTAASSDATGPSPAATSPAPTSPPQDATSATAAPSETATTAPPSFADVDGTWCAADDATDCFTITLPSLVTAQGVKDYVYPSGEPTGDPNTWSYADMAPGPDGCFATSTDSYPPVSGAELVFCPAGSVSAEVNDLAGDSTVDRIFITQETDAMPFYRSDG